MLWLVETTNKVTNKLGNTHDQVIILDLKAFLQPNYNYFNNFIQFDTKS